MLGGHLLIGAALRLLRFLSLHSLRGVRSTPMSRSVIVPAHNEAASIRSTLDAMLDTLDQDTSVIVVCNGCTDDTAVLARRFSPRVTVIERAEASKTAALNAAEAVVSAGPRAYVDADVLISGASINRLLNELGRGSGLASEPTVNFDVGASSVLVRAYYAVWTALHSVGDVGGGVYCLSQAARERFGEFPDVISDDGYVRAHFTSGEITQVGDAVSTVRAPTDVGTLIRIKTRSRRGSVELAERFPELWATKVQTTDSLVRKVSRLPLRVWPKVPVYIIIQLLVRYRAKRSADASSWERDESSRSTP